MNNSTVWKVIAIISRLIVAVVFIGAAIPKIMHPHEFAVAIFRYQAAPYATINIGAVFMPWLEIVVGLTILFWGKFRDAAATITFGMLTVFTVAIASAIFRGIDIGCGCFSVNPHAQAVGWLSILRNLVLMALTAVIFYDAWKKNYSTPTGSLP